MKLDVRRLKLVREIARTGSISAAAQSLGVAQPLLSTQLRDLEAQFSVDLFQRHARGMVLTEVGKMTLVHADRILDAFELAETDLLARQTTASSRVCLGMPYSIPLQCLGWKKTGRKFACARSKGIRELLPNGWCPIVATLPLRRNQLLQGNAGMSASTDGPIRSRTSGEGLQKPFFQFISLMQNKSSTCSERPEGPATCRLPPKTSLHPDRKAALYAARRR